MMDHEKAIRAAKLTLGGILEKRRAKTAVERAEGQIAPSKYLPNVPRQVHANGGYVPAAALPVGRLAVAGALPIQRQPGLLDALGSLASIGKSATSIADLVSPEKEEAPRPHADRVEARAEGLTPEATAAMEALRKGWAGQDFGIVSGYRTPEENRAAKGAKDSQHTHGNAYDVNTTGWSPEEKLALADAAWDAGFRGFGFYDNNMHFDVGGERAWGPSYSRDSIPDWAQGWAQERYGYAEGGEVTDLGQAREQKQLQTFHTGMMDDIHTRMTHAMEAHQKAVDAGVFDGYEVGDTLQGSAHPMRITGRYMQAWKPTTMALRSFERMGTDPTIIEHEGKQYIPMLRYQTGKEGVDGFQEGTAYLDGVRAAGYQKMGGLRAVKARGGAVEFMKGNHPLVPNELYHGNALKIAKKGWTDEIDPEGTRRNMEGQDFKEFKPSEYGSYGPGIYLSDSPKIASDFAQAIRADQKEPQPFGQVMKLHVSMKQPFHDEYLKNPAWKDYIKNEIKQGLWLGGINRGDKENADALIAKLDDGTATVRDLFLRDTPDGTMVNQFGQDKIHKTIRNSGFDGIIAHRPDGSKEYVAFKPEQVKSAISATKFDPTDPDITKAEGGAVDGVDAYHGSPHDFDAFDISKIGTGEGNQSYGHGLYFAGNEGVAKGYRAALADTLAHPEGTPNLEKRAGQMALTFGDNTPEGAIKWLSKFRSGATHTSPAMTPELVGAVSKRFESGEFKPGGHMYKVRLNVQPHELVEWDKPLSEQHPNIQAVLGTGNETAGGKLNRANNNPMHAGDIVGKDRATPQEVSKYLLSKGIKGIRYRDAGSRNMTDGDPTHNYVMFHHDPVKVVNKYEYGGTVRRADGGSVPQKTVKAYKLFRTKGDGNLYPLFVNAEKPVPMGEWLEAEEGPQGKAQGKVKSKLGDLAYRPGWHAGDLPMATHIGGKSDPSLKKPDYRPDNHVWAEVEMAADKDWQSVADSRGKGVKAHITDQVPFGGFYRYKTNPNMTGNWLIGGNMKVNRVLPDEEVKAINDQAGTADLPRLPRGAFAAGGAAMFEGIHEDLQDEQGKPLELWHGTPGEGFSEFKDEKLGSTRDHGFYGRGHYLTPDLEGASEYAGESPDEGTVMGPLHAALKNPYIWDASDQGAHRTLRDLQSMGIMKGQGKLEAWDNLQRHHIDPFMAEMQKRGHDGVVVRTNDYSGEKPHRVSEVVVFKPTAIKHKDAAVFDPKDPNIYRANGGAIK
jgi:hypothetical protein